MHESAVAEPATVSARPAPARSGVPPLGNLEAVFWNCDYVATTRGIEATPIDACNAVFDELKAARFGGDFEQLLDWWRRHKAAQHQKLARAQR